MRNKNTWPIYSISDLWVSQCRKQEEVVVIKVLVSRYEGKTEKQV